MLLVQLREGIVSHLWRHAALYFFILTLLVLGIVSGAVSVAALAGEEKAQLVSYLKLFFRSAGRGSLDLSGAVLLRDVFFANLKTAGVMWFLGLSVVGAPLVSVVLFIRGFALGFTVGFLVDELGFRGLLLALLSVLPPNLVAIPAWSFLGVSALSFAVYLFRRGRRDSRRAVMAAVSNYLMAGLLGVAMLFLSGLIDAYVSPVFINILGAGLGD